MKSKSYFRLVSLVLSIVIMLSLCAISSSAFSENSHDFLEDKFEFISSNPSNGLQGATSGIKKQVV